jgi:hypothetical protein
MKKRFTRIMAALALLVFMMPSLVGWGQTRETKTDVLNRDLTGVTGTSYTDWSGKTSNSNAVWAGNSAGGNESIQLRSKNSNSGIVSTTSGGTLKSVTVTWNSNTANGRTLNVYGKNTAYESASDLYNTNNQGTLLGTIVYGTSTSLTISGSYEFIGMRSASDAMYFTTINVEWETGGSTPTVAAPTFSPAAGTYTQAQNVSISCATEGATIYYTLDGSTPDENSTLYASPISISETTTVKAIGVKEGYTNSSVATATYTFPTLITIAEAKALDENEYALVQGVVTFIDGKNVFIQDETAGIDLFLNANASDVALGDKVKVYGKKTTYNGLVELTSIDQNSSAFSIISTGNALPLATKTIAEVLAGAANTLQCTRVKIEDAVIGTINTNGNTPLTQDNSSINIYKVPSLSEIQSGDHVNVIGVIGYFNAAQLRVANADDVEKIVNTDPSINIANATISVSAEGASGTLAVTYTNITEINAEVIFCDANGNAATYDWITANINSDNNVAYTINANDGEARTAYLKVKVGDTYSNLVTINQEEYVAPTVATLPFTYDGNGQGTLPDGFTVNGLSTYNSSPKMQFNSTGDWAILHFGERPGTLTFDIKGNSFSGGTFKVQTSEDGETYTDLKTYTELGNTQSESFNNLGENVRYIKWIYIEKSSGNVALGNIALAKYTEPQQYTLTVESFENLELITFVNDEMVMEGDGEITVTEGDEIMLSVVANEGYVMQTLMVNGVNHVNDIADDYTYTFVMPAENVTISATAMEDVPVTPGTWVLTDLADLAEDDVFVIVGDNGDTYAMPVDGGGQSGAPAAVAVTVVEGTLSGEPAANLQWNISITEDGYTFYPNGETETWLYCTNTNNGVRVGTNENNVFTMSENGYLLNTATERYIGIYNSQDWRCYKLGNEGAFPTNIANQTFAFYKKVEPETESYTLTIDGYTNDNSKAGYYLIASPVTVNIADVAGLTEGDFDLYSYDESQELEWINYEQEDGSHPFTTLEPGKGYLYAKKATAETPTYTFTLTGTPYDGTPIVLSKQSTGTLAGWNLIGNPSATSNIAPGRAFYIMNSTIGELIASESSTVEPKQGFFVIATEDGEEFEWTAPLDGNLGKVVMNLSRNRGTVVDRAIVRFGEGDQLPKFQLNPNNTKIYFAQADNDYAVVRSANEGEMPVSFRAAENGTYTLSFSAENTEMRYMHLIDNMTGNDIDLLQTPSYSFEAKTTDYANRFRIVFNANNGVDEMNEEQFAFFNGSEWVINSEGEATLQVIDMMGRVVSSQTVNGNANVNINEAKGVYVIRLIQNDLVKTQKIVKE